MKLVRLFWQMVMLGGALALPQIATDSGNTGLNASGAAATNSKLSNTTELQSPDTPVNTPIDEPEDFEYPLNFNVTDDFANTADFGRPNHGRKERTFITVTFMGGRQHVGQFQGKQLYNMIWDTLRHNDKPTKWKGIESNNKGKLDTGGHLEISPIGPKYGESPDMTKPALREGLIDILAHAYQVQSQDRASCFSINLQGQVYHWCQVPKYARVVVQSKIDAKYNTWLYEFNVRVQASFPSQPDQWKCGSLFVEEDIMQFIQDNTDRYMKYGLQQFLKTNQDFPFENYHVDCE